MNEVIIAEIPVNKIELLNIANANKCSTLSKPGEIFGVRFLLKNSFKAKNSNFVVNNFVMQVVALGKDNVMKKEDIAMKTKIQTVIKEKEVVKKELKTLPEFSVDNPLQELF